jgi:hypothetical protein
MPAMPYAGIPAFMKRLRVSQGMSARALEYTVLTVARESMTLEATWGEINDDIWNFHQSRMKERAFRQPLSTGAQAGLKVLRPARPGPTHSSFRDRRACHVQHGDGHGAAGARAGFHVARDALHVRDWAGDDWHTWWATASRASTAARPGRPRS